jgi:hypothetical protein
MRSSTGIPKSSARTRRTLRRESSCASKVTASLRAATRRAMR